MTDVLLLPSDSTSATDGAAEADGIASHLAELQATLAALWDALRKLLLTSRTNRAQAEQWLVNTLAGLFITSPGTKRRRFCQFLPGGSDCRGGEHAAFSRAVLGLLLEAEPAQVCQLLVREPALLRRFFRDDPARAASWFGHFSMGGMRDFKHGAAALARFALARRAEVWHLLEWEGRHSQAPVAVAQRTHYFCELDVRKSVANLVRECPEFWSSSELAAATTSGALLQVDPSWWCRELHGWLEEERSGRGESLHRLVCGHLDGPAAWRQLCQRLLPLLPPEDLLLFASGLLEEGSYVPSSGGGGSGGSPRRREGGPGAGGGGSSPAVALPAAWLLLRGVRWGSLGDLVLAAAAGCSQGALLRLLREEEHEEEWQQLQQLIQRMHGTPPAAHHLLRRQLRASQVDEEWQLEKLQARCAGGSSRAGTGIRQEQQRQQQQQGGGGSSTPAAVGLHRLLLLQLLAAGLTLLPAASSTQVGSALVLEQMLGASGVRCGLAAQRSLSDDSLEKRHKHKRHRHSSKRRRKDPQERKARRREAPEGSGGSSSPEAAGEGERSAGRSRRQASSRVPNAGLAAADASWRLGWPGGSGEAVTLSTLSSFELGDAVLRLTAACYAAWRFMDSCDGV